MWRFRGEGLCSSLVTCHCSSGVRGSLSLCCFAAQSPRCAPVRGISYRLEYAIRPGLRVGGHVTVIADTFSANLFQKPRGQSFASVVFHRWLDNQSPRSAGILPAKATRMAALRCKDNCERLCQVPDSRNTRRVGFSVPKPPGFRTLRAYRGWLRK